MNPKFWQNKKVFRTGHTGFKGSWLSSFLLKMGAEVYGYSWPEIEKRGIFNLTGFSGKIINLPSIDDLI